MSNPAKATKRERQRAKAEQRRLAQRRADQRRMLGFTLGAIALIAVAGVAIVAMQGGGAGDGPIRPSASGDVLVDGPPRTSLLAPGDTIPAFSAPGFRMAADGSGGFKVERESVDWSDYVGSPAVISIWAEWCPHCQVELPVLRDVMTEFPGVRLVTILSSIGTQPGPEPDEYLADNELTFPVAVDDEAGRLAQAFGLEAFPSILFVDASGTVTYANTGEVPAAELRAQLEALS